MIALRPATQFLQPNAGFALSLRNGLRRVGVWSVAAALIAVGCATASAQSRATNQQSISSSTVVLQAPRARGGATSDNAGGGITFASLRMKLPFPEGQQYEVYQGFGGSFSHYGLNRYAWDFGLPEGAPVCAAAEGRVVRVKQDSDEGGMTRDHFSKANTIVLDHGNGLYTQYLHLMRGSAKVVEGEIVRGGQVLASSGNTGFSSVPHLHFQVQNAMGQSLPATFLDVPGDGIPRQGYTYISANDGRGLSQFDGESLMPYDIFEKNSVRVTNSNLPGHLLLASKMYTLEGEVTEPVRRVALYVMGAQGGQPLATYFANVSEGGRFRFNVNFASVKMSATSWSSNATQSNVFTLALAPVSEDGSYWSSFSIPVAIR